jgi:hypothetical protein
MGGPLDSNNPCAKGPIPYCLDECSKGRGARRRLRRLRDAIASLAPTYQGLEGVFDTYLVSHIYKDPQIRQDLAAYLKKYWFDESSNDAYFKNQHVAVKYAEGVLKTLELSLNGRQPGIAGVGHRPVPINAWWLVESKEEVKLLTLADVNDKGVTVGDRVTLLILTPRPSVDVKSTTRILGKAAQAWVTEQRGDKVITRKVENLPR